MTARQASRVITDKRKRGGQPSRAVTRVACVVCDAKFTPSRSDARYCSAKCRQRAARARADADDLGRRIDETRALYWRLVQEYAEARGIRPSGASSAPAATVNADGEVWIDGRMVGWAKPQRPGWTTWGNEAAPPPFLPPTSWADKNFGREAVDNYVRKTGLKPRHSGKETP
jgi:hypothetical protein